MTEEFPAVPSFLLARFPPDQRAAVDHFRGQIDEKMLRLIAEADYGYEADKHLAALEPIWKGAELIEMDCWYPMEVLELIRWSEPHDADWKPGETGEYGHKMRAFVCGVLLATPNFEPEKETLIQMIDSVFSLGRGAHEAVGRFLTWKLTVLEREEDRPFFALALAAIVQFLDRNLAVTLEKDVANWVQQEEESERRYLAEFHSDYLTSPWLFGLSFTDMRNGRWRTLIRAMQKAGEGRPLGDFLVGKAFK